MSFNFEFVAATAEDAQKVVDQENAPACVKDFIRQALPAFPGKKVSVKAFGHLFNGDYQNGDYQISSVDVVVKEVIFRVSK